MRESQYLKRFEVVGEVRARRADLLKVLQFRLGGPAPESIRLAIEGTNDLDRLNRWFDTTFTVESWSEFEESMKQH